MDQKTQQPSAASIEKLIDEVSGGHNEATRILRALRDLTDRTSQTRDRLLYLKSGGIVGENLVQFWSKLGAKASNVGDIARFIDQEIMVSMDELKRVDGALVRGCTQGNTNAEAIMSDMERFFRTIPGFGESESDYIKLKYKVFMVKLIRLKLVDKKLVDFYHSEEEEDGCRGNVVRFANKVDRMFRQRFAHEEPKKVLESYKKSIQDPQEPTILVLKQKILGSSIATERGELFTKIDDILTLTNVYIGTEMGETNWTIFLHKMHRCAPSGSDLVKFYNGEEIKRDPGMMVEWVDRRYHQGTKQTRYLNFAKAVSLMKTDPSVEPDSPASPSKMCQSIEMLLKTQILKYEKRPEGWMINLCNILTAITTHDVYVLLYILHQGCNAINKLFKRNSCGFRTCWENCGHIYKELYCKVPDDEDEEEEEKPKPHRNANKKKNKKNKGFTAPSDFADVYTKYLEWNKKKPDVFNPQNLRLAACLYCLFAGIEELIAIIVFMRETNQLRVDSIL
jgi:hypothetical protein